MAMPRPLGKFFRIAQRVIPDLYRKKKSNGKKKPLSRGSMSEVEIMQTNNIEKKED